MTSDLPFDPDYVVHPGATVRAWRKEQGLSIAEAAERCAMTPERFEEIERGLVELHGMDAYRLSQGTGSPQSFWLERERQFREGLAKGKTWTR